MNQDTATALSAMSEPKFSGEELAEEIMPLLKEYFKGEITREKEEVYFHFHNGQQFMFAVKEIL